jgi:hypothetical protein
VEVAGADISHPGREIAYVDVRGDGPGPRSFSRMRVVGASSIEARLAAGEWLIVVDAYDGDGSWMGTGRAAVSVVEGRTVRSHVELSAVKGTGGLSIGVSLPAANGAKVAVVGALEAPAGKMQSIAFEVGRRSATFSTSSLEAGYYLLTLQILRNGIPAWGRALAVRVLDGLVTTVRSTAAGAGSRDGNAELAVRPDLGQPIPIALSGQQMACPPGIDMTIASATPHDLADARRWYLDGDPVVDESGPSIEIGAGLSPGRHELDLVVFKGGVFSSRSHSFSVLEAPAAVVRTNVDETGTSLDIYLYKGPQFDVGARPIYAMWVEDISGAFVQDLLVCRAAATNVYPLSDEWVARPMSVPYWAHKCCIENPYAGDARRNTEGMYLALPAGDGGPPPFPEGPIPSDLDAVTSATRLTDFRLETARRDDGLSQFRVLLEIQKAWDYNSYYTRRSYRLPGQPSLVYGVTVDAASTRRLYAMSLLGAGHPFGEDGHLHSTSQVTTALDIVGAALVCVRP